MIKTVEVEQRCCDWCGGDAYEWTRCFGCGKDLCSEGVSSSSAKPHGVRYAHGVQFSGSGDGYYCLPCDMRLSEDKSDSLHQAYVAIRDIRDRNQRLYAELEAERKTVESLVTTERAKRGL